MLKDHPFAVFLDKYDLNHGRFGTSEGILRSGRGPFQFESKSQCLSILWNHQIQYDPIWSNASILRIILEYHTLPYTLRNFLNKIRHEGLGQTVHQESCGHEPPASFFCAVKARQRARPILSDVSTAVGDVIGQNLAPGVVENEWIYCKVLVQTCAGFCWKKTCVC